jgi:hypothetical protein
MLRNVYRMPWRERAPLAALLLLTLFAAGCSSNSSSIFGGPGPATSDASAAPAAPPTAPPTATPQSPAPIVPPASSLKDKIANFFSGASAKEPQAVANATPQQQDIECPYIDIREGAATLTIPPPPPDGANEAMALKYQGTFVRAARECKLVNNQMVMRVGVQGRIIVGPAGGPGQVDVPLRIAIVSAPVTGAKTILTKLIRIPVAVASTENATFTHIEDGLTFPLPANGSLDDYIVYIGFDPIGAAVQDGQKPNPAAPKPKLKPKPNPNTPTG